MYIDCILQKWLSFHKNNDFITQILPENVKILTLILPDFYLCFTVGGNLVPPPPPPHTHTHTGRRSLAEDILIFTYAWHYTPV